MWKKLTRSSGTAEKGHRHVDEKYKRGEARNDAKCEKDSSAELDQRDEKRGHVRRGQVERRKEVRHLVEMHQLAPAVLFKLPAPVKTNGKEQRTLQAGG